jgi:predicted esterase
MLPPVGHCDPGCDPGWSTGSGWRYGGDSLPVAKSFSRYRLAILAAALESMRKEWPQSAKWPVAFGGFSGGAKRSALVGAMLAKTGAIKTCGFFPCGINEDRLSEAYRDYRPGGDFLGIPIWLSSGQSDNVAKPQDHDRVKASLQRTGFKHVRLERFSGGHQVNKDEVERALRWFREVAKF